MTDYGLTVSGRFAEYLEELRATWQPDPALVEDALGDEPQPIPLP